MSETIGGLALVFALSNSALSVVTAIMQTSPLVLTIMAVVFLKERIGPPRIIAIFIGFIGVLMAIPVAAIIGVITRFYFSYIFDDSKNGKKIN